MIVSTLKPFFFLIFPNTKLKKKKMQKKVANKQKQQATEIVMENNIMKEGAVLQWKKCMHTWRW